MLLIYNNMRKLPLMVYFRKRLTPEVLGEINEMILRDTAKTGEKNDDDGSGNSGTLTIDTTCALSNIHYPQDVSLLNKARENAEKPLDVLHDPADGKKPRNYRKRAHKDYHNRGQEIKNNANKHPKYDECYEF